ncbi:Integrator complex subunit 6 [Frankliniella fusca]|uniref:Integrator complex subunit 6 n=1 Tax=Frankliniella fusca TaxID=407009 RepID=A0AAE1HY29_9NEOP|nr:Integrator complex subunit 6 [Frankliniella fusca]
MSTLDVGVALENHSSALSGQALSSEFNCACSSSTLKTPRLSLQSLMEENNGTNLQSCLNIGQVPLKVGMLFGIKVI